MKITIEQINLIFKNALNTKKDIKAENTRYDIPEWDSIGHLNLILELEDTLGVSFTKQEIEQMNAISDIILFLDKK